MIKLALILCSLALSSVFIYLNTQGIITLAQLYSPSLQTSLLGGFLAIAGFLLSTKTFILVHMKNEVFDSEHWREKDLLLRSMGRKSTYYKSLQQLGEFLSLSVLTSLITALLHLTTVFLRNQYTISLALSLSILSIILVGASWWFISSNLRTWFKELNKKEQIRIDNALESSDSAES